MKRFAFFFLLALLFPVTFAFLNERSVQEVPVPKPELSSFFIGGTVADEPEGLIYYIASVVRLEESHRQPIESDIEIGAIDAITLQRVSTYQINVEGKEQWWANGLALSPSGKLYSIISKQAFPSGSVTLGGLANAVVNGMTTPVSMPGDYAIYEFPKPKRSGNLDAAARRITAPLDGELDAIAYHGGSIISAFKGGKGKKNTGGFLVVNEESSEQQFLEDSSLEPNIFSFSVSPGGTLFASSMGPTMKDSDKILVYDFLDNQPKFRQAIMYDPQKQGADFVGGPLRIVAQNDYFFVGTTWGFIETFYPEKNSYQPHFQERLNLGGDDGGVTAMASIHDRLLVFHGISEAGPSLASASFDSVPAPLEKMGKKEKTVLVQDLKNGIQAAPNGAAALQPAALPLVIEFSMDAALQERIQSKTSANPYEVLEQNLKMVVDGKELSPGQFVIRFLGSNAGPRPFQIVIPPSQLTEESKIEWSAQIPPLAGEGILVSPETTPIIFGKSNGRVLVQLYEKENVG